MLSHCTLAQKATGNKSSKITFEKQVQITVSTSEEINKNEYNTN